MLPSDIPVLLRVNGNLSPELVREEQTRMHHQSPSAVILLHLKGVDPGGPVY